MSRAEAIKKIQQAISPASMKQALAGPDADKWKTAKDAEHRSLEDNTFQYVSKEDVPEGTKIIKSIVCVKNSYSCCVMPLYSWHNVWRL